MKLIEGTKIADKIIDKVKAEVDDMPRKPKLSMFLVGNDPSSKIYIKKKQEFCERSSIESKKILLEESASTEEVVEKIKAENEDDSVDAILVQLPLPNHIDQQKILSSISIEKDVDCLHPDNFGQFCAYGSKIARVAPITAKAIEHIVSDVDFQIEGKKAVVVGYSNIVGKPAAMMLAEHGATVTICHDKTIDLGAHTRKADILVVAAGRKHLINGDMVKKHSFVIDVGINRINGKIYGDVDFEAVSELASYLTPVPGGVGPVTVAVLMENTLKLAKRKI